MPNWLAIDTSTDTASVALMVDGHIASKEQHSQRTHALSLLPMIEQLRADAGLSLNQLDGIIFGCGPGSFTGLRIACSIAKGLAYAHDLGLIPVSSLAAIAWSAREQSQDPNVPILAVLDARMHELYWSYFAPGQLTAEARVNAAPAIQVLTNKPMILAGVSIEGYWPELSCELQAQVMSTLNLSPSAASMIYLAQAAAIEPIAAEKAQPVYVRNQVTQGGSSG